jgi:beta-mannosidase
MRERGRVRAVSGHGRAELAGDWRMSATPAGACDGPAALATAGPFVAATAPCTAASALRAAGAFDLERSATRRFDGEDWWFSTSFTSPEIEAGDERVLVFDGLATLADVWIDGEHALSSDDMFLAHEVALPRAGEHELVLRCRSLDAALAIRKPSPRWRAPMVENQKLRFFRTTLLGRTPGWSPPVPPVGPFRAVFVEHRSAVDVGDVRIAPKLDEDGDGLLGISCRVRGLGRAVRAVAIELARGGATFRAALAPSTGERFAGHLQVPRVDRWWPHTHGEPALYAARLLVAHDGGETEVDLGPVGFRALSIATERDSFRVLLDELPVFCRGAVWTPLDPVSFNASDEALAAAFDQVTGAGMNMLRVSGAIGYESDAFLDLCDARGVLLWQDFAFANLDYPDEDPAFVALVEAEARQELLRLSGRPSLAVLCGASESEQQAAMWGAPRERWAPRLTHEILPRLARELAPDVTYWPSSAHGGAFPHQASAGTTSYYGVGAYLRPLEDARRAEVRFASECLAFANVPSSAGLPGGASTRAHHPAWKARSPRDLGAGWDFDDVRDHYLARLFGVDPLALRYADHERYLALSRATSGEVMAAVFAEWRRARSPTGGGLVWFWRDLWAGAGWGVLEANGAPKAAYHYLRRALQPTAIAITDEGVNGLALHLVHEGPAALDGEVRLALYRGGETAVGDASLAVHLAPRGVREIAAVSLLDGFVDLSYAYRFGPPTADLVVASLVVDTFEVAQAFHLPLGLGLARERDLGLTAQARRLDDGSYELTVATRRFAQSIAIEARGYEGDDDWFHLAPGASRTTRLRALPAAGPLRGVIQALNAESSTPIVVAP